jgi:hypothetical protein
MAGRSTDARNRWGHRRHLPLQGVQIQSNRTLRASLAQSIGLVNTGPDQASKPKEVEYLTQLTSTDTLVLYIGPPQRRG